MNPILQKIQDGVDQIASEPGSKEQYDRILLAGKKIMFDPATHDKISWMQNPSDMAALVTGVADLIAIIGEKSNNTMQDDPAAGAAVSLVMEALDFAERAQGVAVTQETADAAVMAMNEKMQGGGQGEQHQAPQEPAAQQPMAQPPAQPRGLITTGV